ncbi:MAG TPA: NADH-quinone oxidoreductase subunit C [Casimicrobiaceae bacterium]|nr:NADH-quinone oxidoreductase subunit C [Casimicrobiaceae bacterium]
MVAAIAGRIEQEAVAAGGRVATSHGMTVVTLLPENLLGVIRRLKAELGFDLLLDVTAVDWPERTPRFDVVYHLYSTTQHVRVRVKTAVSEGEPVVESLVSLYGSAGFAERECHDMYGIVFRGNADLRPILLYEGFTGHPLRKDYPKLAEQPLVPYRTERT